MFISRRVNVPVLSRPKLQRRESSIFALWAKRKEFNEAIYAKEMRNYKTHGKFWIYQKKKKRSCFLVIKKNHYYFYQNHVKNHEYVISCVLIFHCNTCVLYIQQNCIIFHTSIENKSIGNKTHYKIKISTRYPH